MARFLDHHPSDPNMPAEAVQGIREKLQAGQPDEFGVVGLDVLVADDLTYCYTDGPSADAVRQSHEKMGVNLGLDDIREVQSLA